MRPLYLDPGYARTVQLDGPALYVTGERRAAGRYPLSRISRVIVRGDVELRTAALLACLEHGVPVVFLDAAGNPRGACFGNHRRERALGSLLRELLELDNWRDYYGVWLAAMERRAILRATSTLRIELRDLRADRAWNGCVNRVAGGHNQKEPARTLYRYLQGLVTAHTAEGLYRAGINADTLYWKRAGLNLVEDIAKLQFWGLHELVQDFVRAKSTDDIAKCLTIAFEQKSMHFDVTLKEWLNQIEQWIRELLV